MRKQIIDSYYFGFPEYVIKEIDSNGFIPSRYLLDLKTQYSHNEIETIGNIIRPIELGVKLYNNGWYKTDETLPESNTKVMGYSKEWIDVDFNIDGIRECIMLEDDPNYWFSIKWNGTHDDWFGDETTNPTHWKPYPSEHPIR